MDGEDSACNLLERVLLDASAEPIDLPLSFLKAITNNFSDDKRIGIGGFAVVYKGVLPNGTVAVKKLLQMLEVDDKKFNQEIDSLMRVKHKNIVRFLGYCADTQGKVWKYEGKNVMAEERQRLLCFEFLSNGSLDKYISDASKGIEWRTRYKIIKGICEGLHYLHQQKIVHSDLKPANILLDYNMAPKIADFGLSKCFGENQTRAITSKVLGSQGYMSPEFYSGVITFNSDIYSLGIIITEILTGQKGFHDIKNVLDSWSPRLEHSPVYTQLEHVRVCIEIGIKCIDTNPANRPDTWRIIGVLDDMERTYGFVETDLYTSLESLAKTGYTELGQGSTPNQLPGERDSETAPVGEESGLRIQTAFVGQEAYHLSSQSATVGEEIASTTTRRGGRKGGRKAPLKLPSCFRHCFLAPISPAHDAAGEVQQPLMPPGFSKSKGPSSGVQQFTLEMLHAATDGFSDDCRIGTGSFGSVYRGTLSDGREVAIKRAEDSTKASTLAAARRRDREVEFNSELTALARANHKNIVCLLGFCAHSDERVLVYEFTANGTLHDQLHSRDPIAPAVSSWRRRLAIALDAARGIEYMHVYAVPPIIHRDVKSANILLDGAWNAKVTGFGLSSVLDPTADGEPPYTGGTVGYMDPEYYRMQHLTDKSDVYSFGVVLLELMSGCRAVQRYDESETPMNVVEFAVPHILNDSIARVLDPRLPTPTAEEAEALGYVGYLAADCVGPVGSDRSSMTEVLDSLGRAVAACCAAPLSRAGSNQFDLTDTDD